MTARRRRPRTPRPQTLSMDWFTDQDPSGNPRPLEVPTGYMEMGLRCPHCGHAKNEFLRSTADRPNLICPHCQNLSSISAWRIIYIKYAPAGV